MMNPIDRKTLTLLMVGMLLPGLAGAAGPYRDNQPDVIGGVDRDAERAQRRNSASVDPAEAVARFSLAYVKAKKPRIAVYWNRKLSESAGSQWVASDRVVVQEESRFKGTFDGRANDATDSKTTAISHQTRVDAGAERRGGPGELEMARFEDGMLGAFSEAGCHLVDRNVILRMAPEGDGQGGSAIESAALQRYADLLMEVVLIPSRGTRSGFAFRISAKNLKNGRILASLVHQPNELEAGEGGEWVAGPNGYELKQDPSGFFDHQGRLTGMKLMQSLAGTL
ncbi:MAG: hypothetical protein HQM02_09190 [Magnetococcales bacterium]|nr:hypothetical protein [Magnetococcales bacterium]